MIWSVVSAASDSSTDAVRNGVPAVIRSARAFSNGVSASATSMRVPIGAAESVAPMNWGQLGYTEKLTPPSL